MVSLIWLYIVKCASFQTDLLIYSNVASQIISNVLLVEKDIFLNPLKYSYLHVDTGKLLTTPNYFSGVCKPHQETDVNQQISDYLKRMPQVLKNQQKLNVSIIF